MLAEPPLAQAAATLLANREVLGALRAKIGDDLVAATRQDVLQLAIDYSSQYRNCDWVERRASRSQGTWIVTGHQPQLFHPGVWIKNFALSALADRQQAIALNLVVDNDLCSDSSLPMPVRQATPANSASSPRWRQEAFLWDLPSAPVPYEDRHVRDGKLFASFLERTRAEASELSERPLIHKLWATADCMRRQGRPVGECFAAARHAFEATVGLKTLEAPLGRVFDLPTVRRWTAGVLEGLPPLHSLYNSSLQIFRKTHRIRSRSHPVPDLAADEDWLESPFWVWSKESPARRPLWTRRRGNEAQLSDGHEWRASGPDFYTALEAANVSHRVRPRALMTTMFARTILADLFIHGIGGAKYDQLTDAILLKYFSLPPPKYLTLTATFRLQDAPFAQLNEEVRVQRRLLRDLRFNPQRHLGADAETTPLLEKKAALLRQNHDMARRHQEIKAVNAALQPCVEPLRQRAEQRLTEAKLALQQARVLGSREYSLLWHDSEELPRQLLDLCQFAQ